MTLRSGRVPIAGSERAPAAGAKASGKPGADERLKVTVVLRPLPSPAQQVSAEEIGSHLPHERRYLKREEIAAVRGAAKEDIARVRTFASENSLDIVEVNPERRSVVLSGSVAQFNRAFGVEMVHFKHARGAYRGHAGPISVPRELAEVVQAVLGLDNRPQASPHVLAPRLPGGVSYTPPELASLYDFPPGLDGTGQCIGIVELGGGYVQKDVQVYFQRLGLQAPSLQSVPVDGASNSPTGDPGGPDGEVMLDIEVAAGVAPRARVAVYFAPNTDQGFYDAVSTAIHDKQNRPSVLSISWGSPESQWSQQGMTALNQAFQDSAMLGVTVCAAAGDGGSSDGLSDGLAHADFPASSPYVLGCGGTSLSSAQGRITSEVVWNDLPQGGATGGGVSDAFPLPAWQNNVGVPASANPGGRVGRGVPDVCADADPMTGYKVRVDGSDTVFGGTSAVAPFWAGLLALVNQGLGRSVGFLDPLLYGRVAAAAALRDITSGNNGAYAAKSGWDPCTGLGSPDGKKLAGALSP